MVSLIIISQNGIQIILGYFWYGFGLVGLGYFSFGLCLVGWFGLI